MKVYYIEENFDTIVGHYYENYKSIAEEFSRRNIDVILYANRRGDSKIAHIGAIPFFRYKRTNYENKFMKLFNQLQYAYFFYFDLKRLFKTVRIDKEDIVLGSTVAWNNFFVYALFLSLNKQVKAKIILTLRTSLLESSFRYKLYKFSIYLLRNRISNKNVVITTDSNVISHEWKTSFQMDVPVLPIPHVHAVIDQSNQSDGIRLLMPGEARIEKGIDTLVDAIEHLIIKDELKRFIFVIQLYNFGAEGRHKQLKMAIDKLECICNKSQEALKRIIIFRSNLISSEYYKQIAKADVILVPYRASIGYYARTSGIFVEAVAAGKPIITSDGTWMAAQLKKNVASGLVIKENDPLHLADAIIRIADNIGSYKQIASVKSANWLAIHNAASFCDLVFSL